jgi:outer membrane protein OmpA-like peptidoglycan-associated protein
MTRWQSFVGAVLSLALAGGFVLSTSSPSLAQRPSEEQILNALKPSPKTRGLTTGSSGQAAEEQRFIDSIRRGKTRQLTLSEREKAAEIARNKPAIDLEIYFDYNSSAITKGAEPELKKLGRALTNSDLKGSVFLVAGHTDGKGTEDYNQGLSERRAQAVKRYLMDKFDISDDSLVATGYGKSKLKNSDDPYASENRRVQVVNMDPQATAER